MAKRKRRTSIRTAAKTTQESYLARIRRLREDPMRILPECPDGEPKPIQRLRSRLEKVAAGKAGFRDKRDREIVGAMVHILPVAEQSKVPRLADMRVGSQRRFFLQRGQVSRSCSVGVQNHDDPRTLILAYEPMAKKHNLHFFAGADTIWCTGGTPAPPAQWVSSLPKPDSFAFTEVEEGHWTCPHTNDRPQVVLAFDEAHTLAVCGACGKATGNLHQRLHSRHMGPDRRRPVEVRVRMPSGEEAPLEDQSIASYRAGVTSETQLIQEAAKKWREQTGGVVFLLGEKDFGDNQEAFLDHLEPHDWERPVIAELTAQGHQGDEAGVADLLGTYKDRLLDAMQVLLEDPAAFAAHHTDAKPRELLRLAHEEQGRRDSLAKMPELDGLGPLGSWIDATVRFARSHAKSEMTARLRRQARSPPVAKTHIYAFVRALGGDLSIASLFDESERSAGEELAPLVTPLLEAEGDDYKEALAGYLQRSGSGESL